MHEREIMEKLLKAFGSLPGEPRPLSHVVSDCLYQEAERRGATSDLLGILGSWGDTLDDGEIAALLDAYNRRYSSATTPSVMAESPLRY